MSDQTAAQPALYDEALLLQAIDEAKLTHIAGIPSREMAMLAALAFDLTAASMDSQTNDEFARRLKSSDFAARLAIVRAHPKSGDCFDFVARLMTAAAQNAKDSLPAQLCDADTVTRTRSRGAQLRSC